MPCSGRVCWRCPAEQANKIMATVCAGVSCSPDAPAVSAPGSQARPEESDVAKRLGLGRVHLDGSVPAKGG